MTHQLMSIVLHLICITIVQAISTAEYASLKAAVRAKIPAATNNGNFARADFIGGVVRLAGHDFMDFKGGKGGQDGCIDFAQGDNRGLSAIAAAIRPILSTWNAAHATRKVSLADFWVIAANTAIEAALPRTGSGFTTIPFKWGRKTPAACNASVFPAKMPNAEAGCPEVQRVFRTNLGLTWPESAALMGVHTLGRGELQNSGYQGPWTPGANGAASFDNRFYSDFFRQTWRRTINPAAITCPNCGVRHQWRWANNNQNLMLTTDLCLAYNIGNTQAQLDAQTCLAGNGGGGGGGAGLRGKAPHSMEGLQAGARCPFTGPAAASIQTYANNQVTWHTDFLKVWAKVTALGQAANLKALT